MFVNDIFFYLAGHQDKGDGHPVVVKDHPVRAEEGEVEPDRRCWLQVSLAESDKT